MKRLFPQVNGTVLTVLTCDNLFYPFIYGIIMGFNELLLQLIILTHVTYVNHFDDKIN